MIKICDFDSIRRFTQFVRTDKVYLQSITDNKQYGEIFADRKDAPGAVLFWHYCGFAYIAGEPDESFLSDTAAMMKAPEGAHSGRLVLMAGKDEPAHSEVLLRSGVKTDERYMFDYIGTQKRFTLPDSRFELKRTDHSNYGALTGRIVPAFSWRSEAEFLENGFGFCVMYEGRAAACAFSAGISDQYCDIGVETAEEFRGMGLAKAAAQAMTDEIIAAGLIPVWGCSISNAVSMKLACSVGFRVKGTHPVYHI